MQKLRGGILGAFLALAVLLPATPALAVAPAGTNLQFLSWNICGYQRANWGCSSFGTWANKLALIQGQIQDNYAFHGTTQHSHRPVSIELGIIAP